MRRQYRKEAIRCVCQHGGDAHPQHAKPGNVVGLHMHPLCTHSELYNAVVRFPRMREQQSKKKQFVQPLPRYTLK